MEIITDFLVPEKKRKDSKETDTVNGKESIKGMIISSGRKKLEILHP